MLRRLSKLCIIITMSCWIFIGTQFNCNADELDAYYFQISYEYKTKDGKYYKIDSSEIESPSLSETSDLSKGSEVKIPQMRNTIILKDNNSLNISNRKLRVRNRMVHSDDEYVKTEIFCSLDGTFEMPAADVCIEIILEDSDE